MSFFKSFENISKQTPHKDPPTSSYWQKTCLPQSLGNLSDSGGNDLLASICNCPVAEEGKAVESDCKCHVSIFVWSPRGQSGTVRRLRFCLCL